MYSERKINTYIVDLGILKKSGSGLFFFPGSIITYNIFLTFNMQKFKQVVLRNPPTKCGKNKNFLLFYLSSQIFANVYPLMSD